MFGYMLPDMNHLKAFYFFVNDKAEYTRDRHREVHSWCYDQFGPEGEETWAGYSEGTFFFEKETDAVAFRMRWC